MLQTLRKADRCYFVTRSNLWPRKWFWHVEAIDGTVLVNGYTDTRACAVRAARCYMKHHQNELCGDFRIAA